MTAPLVSNHVAPGTITAAAADLNQRIVKDKRERNVEGMMKIRKEEAIGQVPRIYSSKHTSHGEASCSWRRGTGSYEPRILQVT
jgi:hypothetical protein